MVSARFTPTREDYMAFQEFTSWNAPGMKSRRNRARLTMTVLAGALYYLLMRDCNGGLKDPIQWFFLCAVAMAVWFSSQSSTRERMRKQAGFWFDLPGNDALFQSKTVELGDNGVWDRAEQQETHYRWSAFTRREELPDHIFLYISNIHGLMLPKRAFSDQEWVVLKRLLDERLSLRADLPEVAG